MARKKLTFTATTGEKVRQVIEVAGKSVCVLTRIETVTPATVTKADVEALLATAKKEYPDDADSDYIVEIPGLCDVRWCDLEGMESEIANALNEYGVGVEDWPVYSLEG